MSFVAEFTIPSEVLPFGEALAENPGARIEVERIVPTQESALPFFWVWGQDPESFVEAAERDSEIVETRLLERVADGALYRAEWSPNAEVVRSIAQLDATIVSSGGTADRWRFEVRAQDHDSFVEFRKLFEAQGIPVSLERLYDLAELVEGDRQSLTPDQRATLIRAYQDGYYDKPRKTTQKELGEHFGVSARAISDRLRRGTRNLLASTLLPPSR